MQLHTMDKTKKPQPIIKLIVQLKTDILFPFKVLYTDRHGVIDKRIEFGGARLALIYETYYKAYMTVIERNTIIIFEDNLFTKISSLTSNANSRSEAYRGSVSTYWKPLKPWVTVTNDQETVALMNGLLSL